MDQLALCIRGFPEEELYEGRVYTVARRFSFCNCKGISELVEIEELPLVGMFAGARCTSCGRTERTKFHPFDARRFVPINDPDIVLEDEREELEA